MSTLPVGYRLVPDRSLGRHDAGRLLSGGLPVRVLRLTEAGRDAATRLLAGAPVDARNANLAARLVDAGLAHPRPPAHAPALTVEIAIPVRDRPRELERCLCTLGGGLPVTVVDDGSARPEAAAEICNSYGARLLRIAPGRGAAAARNLALQHASSDLIAFIDSDVEPPAAWLESVAQHFADPKLAALAPRVRPRPGSGQTLIDRYSEARSPVDMGADEGQVSLRGRIGYVPSAVLVVRRAALPRPAFDERLLCGEDVDLIWRLQDAGWRIRYLPAAVAFHEEPHSWSGLLRRRHRYGRSAGGLAHRHPDRVAHVLIAPLPTAALALLMLGRPRPALIVVGVHGLRVWRATRRLGLPPSLIARWTLMSVAGNTTTLSTMATRLAGPVIGVGLLSRRARRSSFLLLMAAPLVEFKQRSPRVNVVTWVGACLVDDAVYGAGLITGCVGSRTTAPLRPRLTYRRSSTGNSTIRRRFTSNRVVSGNEPSVVSSQSAPSP